jgi:hypothetical protein
MEQAMKSAKPTSTNVNPVILPLDELRQLVFQIVLRDSIEPFVWQMVILLDSLKAGQTDEVARVAGHNKDPAFTRLRSALSGAVEEGELGAARITVFLAAGYAYQESLDYYWDLMNYLNRFKEDAGQTRNPSNPPEAA